MTTRHDPIPARETQEPDRLITPRMGCFGPATIFPLVLHAAGTMHDDAFRGADHVTAFGDRPQAGVRNRIAIRASTPGSVTVTGSPWFAQLCSTHRRTVDASNRTAEPFLRATTGVADIGCSFRSVRPTGAETARTCPYLTAPPRSLP